MGGVLQEAGQPEESRAAASAASKLIVLADAGLATSIRKNNGHKRDNRFIAEIAPRGLPLRKSESPPSRVIYFASFVKLDSF